MTDPSLFRAQQTRRSCVGRTLGAMAAGVLTTQLPPGSAVAVPSGPAIPLGSRRELFVDDFLIERLSGGAELRLHHPQPREVVLKMDLPWEGIYSGYFTILKDGERYRAYTNQLLPYPRAPQVYLGLPTRFMPGRRALDAGQLASIGTPKEWHYANDCVDITLISTRGGSELKRAFLEAFIRPGADLRELKDAGLYSLRFRKV